MSERAAVPYERARIEAELEQLITERDYARFLTVLLRHYGPELRGFVAALLHERVQIEDAFAVCCEHLWRAVPQFRHECSARTWAYAIVRHAALRYRRQLVRERRRMLQWSALPCAQRDREAPDRTTTAPHLRTEGRERIQTLRAQLSASERMLLGLRLDRKLEWLEIAQIFCSTPEGRGVELDVAAARLRQRMQAIKRRLRALLEAPAQPEPGARGERR